MKYDAIKKYAVELNESGKRDIATFINNLNTNPQYAFEWGMSAMEGAAKVDVAAYIAEWLKRAEERGASNEAVALGIIEYAMQQTFRLASQTSQSTSHTSNAMERYTLAAWAALAQKAFERVKYSTKDGTVVFYAIGDTLEHGDVTDTPWAK